MNTSSNLIKCPSFKCNVQKSSYYKVLSTVNFLLPFLLITFLLSLSPKYLQFRFLMCIGMIKENIQYNSHKTSQ